jgi:pimeloyl-ACP methyl ester carboxylesterase
MTKQSSGSAATHDGLTRRGMLKAFAAVTPALTLASQASAQATCSATTLTAQTRWQPPPRQATATEGLANLSGVRLWYWDTGGAGEPIVLLHPATGSGAIWGYQQPVLAQAGYRVIGYSRRGYFRSERGPADATGTGAGDLHALMEFLHIDRFHLVGSAAGGFILPDYALSHPQRLHSMVIASSLGGVQDQEFSRLTDALLPDDFSKLPPEFRELGPSYRAAYPEGVARWLELEHQSVQGTRLRQAAQNELSWASIGTIKVPTLLLTGDADLYMPPSRMRAYSQRLPGSELAIIGEAGHAAFWEQPDAFNAALLAFFKKHGDKPPARHPSA